MKSKEGTEPGKGWGTKNWREVYRSRAFFYKKNGWPSLVYVVWWFLSMM